MIKNKLIILFCFKIRKSIKHKNVQKIKNKKAYLGYMRRQLELMRHKNNTIYIKIRGPVYLDI